MWPKNLKQKIGPSESESTSNLYCSKVSGIPFCIIYLNQDVIQDVIQIIQESGKCIPQISNIWMSGQKESTFEI